MRQLIDVRFRDLTAYSNQVSEDIGAICISHFWGVANKRNTYTLEEFLDEYPLVHGKTMSDSWLSAYRAFLSGLGKIEIARITASDEEYFACVVKSNDITVDRISEVDHTAESAAAVITLKHKGNLPEGYSTTYKQLDIEIEKLKKPANEGDIDIQVSLVGTTANGTVVLERCVGAIRQGQTIDGMDWDIQSVLKASKYFDASFDYEQAKTNFEAISDKKTLKYTIVEGTPVTSEKLCQEYANYFSDIEASLCSILIDCGTASADEASLIAKVAETRMDCVSLVGYPIKSKWEKDEVIKWYQSISAREKFTLAYCIRETFKLGGVTYITNGIGTLAGRYASVAINESVNQIPSAKSWGMFGSALAKSFSFKEVLEMHNLGINGCYNSIQGSRLFGLRSGYPREGSYFARANVSRVCARLLKFAFNVSMDVLHTGNTDYRKAMTQLTLQSDVDRLVAVGALRPESKVICSPANNRDVDTNGGRILIVDYECWFVSLIERVSIRITATDSSVSAALSQG